MSVNSRGTDEKEIMEDITYLISKSHMGFNEILELPFAVFRSLLKHFWILAIEQSPEGRKLLEQSKRLYQTEADLQGLRNSNFYKQQN